MCIMLESVFAAISPSAYQGSRAGCSCHDTECLLTPSIFNPPALMSQLLVSTKNEVVFFVLVRTILTFHSCLHIVRMAKKCHKYSDCSIHNAILASLDIGRISHSARNGCPAPLCPSKKRTNRFPGIPYSYSRSTIFQALTFSCSQGNCIGHCQILVCQGFDGEDMLNSADRQLLYINPIQGIATVCAAAAFITRLAIFQASAASVLTA